MSTEEEFTLEQLAQLSLGGTDFGQINISLLHTIVNLALKRLSCEKEKVTVTGFAAQNLRELLKTSSYSPSLVFNEESFETPLQNLDVKIVQLEEKVSVLEQQFDDHVEKGKQNGSICLEPEENEEIVRQILMDDWFTQHFKEYVNGVFICRLGRLRYNISNLEDRMEKFKEKCKEAHQNLVTMDALQDKYEALVAHMREYRAEFKRALNEIQYLLDTKFDNCDISPLKRRIRDILEHAADSATKVVEMKTRPRAILSCVELDGTGRWQRTGNQWLMPKLTIGACDCEKDLNPKRRPSSRPNPICDCIETPDEKLPLVERIKVHHRENIYRLTWIGTTVEKFSAIKDD